MSDEANTNLGERMQAKAIELAHKKNPALSSAIATVVKAKQEWEGGRFVVMYAFTDNATPEEIDALPVPKSEGGNNPAVFKIRKIGNGGKVTTPEVNYYNVYSDSLPDNAAKLKEIEQLELSLGDPTKVNMTAIPQHILDMHKTYRHTRIERLKDEVRSARSAINRAFELLFQIRAVNALPHVECSEIYAMDPDHPEQVLDGEDGRRREVENTKTPILVRSTIKGREGIDTLAVSLGTFMKFKVDVAAENGGTYKALFDTVKRGTPPEDDTGGDKPDLIKTIDKFKARITDIHDFLDGEVFSATDKTKYQELLKTLGPRGPAGSDPFALSMYELYTMLGDFYKHDAIRARGERLKEEDAIAA